MTPTLAWICLVASGLIDVAWALSMKKAGTGTILALSILSVLAMTTAVSAAGSAALEANYVAGEYRFDGPDTLPPGWVTLRITNAGHELHHARVRRLGLGAQRHRPEKPQQEDAGDVHRDSLNAGRQAEAEQLFDDRPVGLPGHSLEADHPASGEELPGGVGAHQESGEGGAHRRAGGAEEVAQAIVWLLSDAASYTTGAVLDISGGRATY